MYGNSKFFKKEEQEGVCRAWTAAAIWGPEGLESWGQEVQKAQQRKEGYSMYICKVLKQVRPVIGISAKATGIMGPFMNNVLEWLVQYFS